MTQDLRPTWWQTVPGMMTGIAALITAVTGLLVVLNNIGVIGRDAAPPKEAQASPAAGGPAAETAGRAPDGRAPAAAAPTAAAERVLTAEGQQVRIDTHVYTVLQARSRPYNAEKRQFVFRIRLLNDDRFGANFWSDTFRLLVDGVPAAPTNDLNLVVDGHAAKEGDVVFVVPADLTSATLELRARGEIATIPFTVSSPAGSAPPRRVGG